MLDPPSILREPQVPKALAGRPSRVLIVEDDALFRRFSLAALQGARHARIQADTAASWTEASRRLQETPYDCLLLDLGLPESDGIATLRIALQAAPTTPIVVLTGEEDPGIAETALREGAQDFVEKMNADPGVLERAIRHAVDRGRWAAELASKNRQLETRNAELDDFAHAVSHDLKAPLRAIYYFVHDAEEHLKASGSAPAALEVLDGVGPRIQRLFGMIDGVLKLTQAGRAAGETACVDVGQLVEGIVDSLAIPPGFAVAVAPGMPTLVTQEAALTQVFQNLIENAVKHHRGAGGRVEVGWRDAGAFCEFTVADDGPGIPAAMRERAFKLFQTLGRESAGTGIGLALVRKVVEASGGAIGIEDGAGGRGACFRFTWPSGVRS